MPIIDKRQVTRIRAVLREMKAKSQISAYRITERGEVHVRDQLINGTVRQGWVLYGYLGDPILPLMLGIPE